MNIPTPWPFPVYITGGKAHRVPAHVMRKPAPTPVEDAPF